MLDMETYYQEASELALMSSPTITYYSINLCSQKQDSTHSQFESHILDSGSHAPRSGLIHDENPQLNKAKSNSRLESSHSKSHRPL